MTKKNKKQQQQQQQHAASSTTLAQRQPPVPPPSDESSVQQESSYTSSTTHKYASLQGGNCKFAGPTCKDRLALVMMIKNEEARIEVSYDSILPICNTFIILDTGSTDRTIEITRAYCKKHNVTLYLKEEPFVNFEVSRNVLLDFADEVCKHHMFLIQLDSNDECKNLDVIESFVISHDGPQTGFHLRQQWWTGNSLDTYFNIRMVISHFGWRYKGVVHEFITRKGSVQSANDILRLDNSLLFQDRTKDDDKSMRRFKRDKQLLYTEHLRCPDEPRTLFYLAQTCGCLQQFQEAYEYNLLRTKQLGFIEEVYHAYFRLGQISRTLQHPWEESLGWYLKAYAHSRRAEPLVAIAEYYIANNAFGEAKPDWHLAFTFINEACSLAYPHNQILFIDKNVYLYKRWHVMGIVAYYVNRIKEGKLGCIRAMQHNITEVDMNNLVLYLKKEHELTLTGGAGGGLVDMYMTPTTDKLGEMVSQRDIGLGIGNTNKADDILKRAKAKL